MQVVADPKKKILWTVCLEVRISSGNVLKNTFDSDQGMKVQWKVLKTHIWVIYAQQYEKGYIGNHRYRDEVFKVTYLILLVRVLNITMI